MVESSYLLSLLQVKYERINSLLITLINHGQDIKQINYVCPGYTVHIPPSLSGYALELRVVSITYTHAHRF